MTSEVSPSVTGSNPARSLTIVYVWDADYPWDVRTEKVCAALSAAGHRVHIVARNKSWSATEESLEEGTVHRMRPWKWLGRRADRFLSFPAFCSPRWWRLLDRVIRRVAPDLLIVRDLPLCPLALSVGHSRGIPVVLDMAENYAAMMQETWDAGRQHWFDVVIRNPKFVARVEQYCLRRVDHVLTVVEESSDRLVQAGLPSNRAAVVSNTPPRDRAHSAQVRAYDRGGPLNVVYLGLMELPRGVITLLDAVAQLNADGRPVRLTLIGGGRDEELFRARARELELDAVVTFHGYLPNRRALELVAQADVGVVPHLANASWNSTIPNKLFDYMAVGLPVVTSDAVPSARVVRTTQAGIVFRSGDAMDLARAIDRFYDAAARRACGEAGRRAVLDRYNWEASTDILLRVVRDAVASEN